MQRLNFFFAVDREKERAQINVVASGISAESASAEVTKRVNEFRVTEAPMPELMGNHRENVGRASKAGVISERHRRLRDAGSEGGKPLSGYRLYNKAEERGRCPKAFAPDRSFLLVLFFTIRLVRDGDKKSGRYPRLFNP